MLNEVLWIIRRGGLVSALDGELGYESVSLQPLFGCVLVAPPLSFSRHHEDSGKEIPCLLVCSQLWLKP